MNKGYRSKEELKQQIIDFIRDHDGTNRHEIAATLHSGISNISRLMPELIAERSVFFSHGKRGLIRYHSSMKPMKPCDSIGARNGNNRRAIVDAYCRNSPVYRFDKLLQAVRVSR